MTTTATPPRWDLTPIFAGLDDRAFGGALESIFASVDRLVAQFDELDIRATEPRPVTDADVRALDAVLAAWSVYVLSSRPATAGPAPA